MKYIVTQTSMWDENTPPCDGAQQETLNGYHHYTTATIEEAETHPYLRRFKGQFQMLNGNVVRPGKFTVWTVEVDDLLAFVAKNGRIIVDVWDYDYSRWSIEIYNGWRELWAEPSDGSNAN